MLDSTPPAAMSSRPARPTLGTWPVLFLASFAVYALTANRGAQWQDAGMFILRVVTGDLVGDYGLALSHPLHYWLGRLVVLPDLLEPAHAVTLISSLGAALAVANVYGCVRTLTGSGAAAVFAAASLALANTFWHLATISEVYTLSAGLLAAECWCLVAYARRRRPIYLWGMLFFNGLGLANHLQAVLTTPVLLVITFAAVRGRRLTLRDAAIGCALWVVGSLPYTGLALAVATESDDWGKTLSEALFGSGYGSNVLNLSLSGRILAVSFGAILYNFPNLLLPAVVYGITRKGQKQIGVPTLARRALLAALILHAVFALRYNVVDQHTFFLPLYVLLSVFAGVGAAATLRWGAGRRRERVWGIAVLLLAATPLVYWVACSVARKYDLLSVARKHGLLGNIVHHKPYRDDYVYLLIPWSVVEDSAERMTSQAVDLAAPNGLIITEDSMARFALEYKKLRAGADELEVAQFNPRRAEKLLQRIQQAARLGRPVVLVPLRVGEPEAETPIGYHWAAAGDLHVLRPDPAFEGRHSRQNTRSILRSGR